MRRKFTLEELETDPVAAASFLAAFIRADYGWDNDTDPELLSTPTESPLDLARRIAHFWVSQRTSPTPLMPVYGSKPVEY